MLLFLITPLPRQTIVVLLLTGIAACKLVVLLLRLQAGYGQPYVGGNAQSTYLPAASRILTTGTYNDSDTSGSSKQAPGYAVFLALAQWIGARWYLSLVVCLQMLLDYCVALLLLSPIGRVKTPAFRIQLVNSESTSCIFQSWRCSRLQHGGET